MRDAAEKAQQAGGKSPAGCLGYFTCGSLLVPNAQATDDMRTLLKPHMLNCIRFGTINGAERAMVSAQNGTGFRSSCHLGRCCNATQCGGN